jgi:N-methylhydantoinase A
VTDMASTGGYSRIGVDIGGTFTDVAAVDSQGRLRIGKRLTTHGAENEGAIQAVLDTGIDPNANGTLLAHGTTLVINALLERKGAKVALVTTRGFADVLDIGRGNRSDLFNLRYRRQAPLVPRELRFEVHERTYGDGVIGNAPTDSDLATLVAQLASAQAESIAVALLNSYVNPKNEELVADYIRRHLPDVPVTTSSSLSRQWREYERFTTATANAYIAPVAHRYLHRLVNGVSEGGFRGEFVVLDSSGGAMTLDTAINKPVQAVESGPVGGVIAARALAARLGIEDLCTFDMGGTTAKSALIENGDYARRDLYWIGGERKGFPLQVSTVDIIETAVGGGSIASLNNMRELQVGPRSAGSRPGPACYGLGGVQPTLTDANLYCGRINRDHFAGNFTLDLEAASRAIEGLAKEAGLTPDRLALGIIRLANLRVASTVRRQTLERGNDPRKYSLLASGGAGPLHVCEVAKEVGINRVLIPRFPGHYSALGMLGANLRRERRELVGGDLAKLEPAQLQRLVNRIAHELRVELESTAGGDHDIKLSYALAVRFRGQEHTLWISVGSGTDVPDDFADRVRQAFDSEYERRYGHIDALSSREAVELQVVMERALPPVPLNYYEPEAGERTSQCALWNDDGFLETQVIPRASLRVGETIVGPVVLYETGSTSAIPPGAVARVLEDGTIMVQLG